MTATAGDGVARWHGPSPRMCWNVFSPSIQRGAWSIGIVWGPAAIERVQLDRCQGRGARHRRERLLRLISFSGTSQRGCVAVGETQREGRDCRSVVLEKLVRRE